MEEINLDDTKVYTETCEISGATDNLQAVSPLNQTPLDEESLRLLVACANREPLPAVPEEIKVYDLVQLVEIDDLQVVWFFPKVSWIVIFARRRVGRWVR
mgnify:CR=1 FL=1